MVLWATTGLSQDSQGSLFSASTASTSSSSNSAPELTTGKRKRPASMKVDSLSDEEGGEQPSRKKRKGKMTEDAEFEETKEASESEDDVVEEIEVDEGHSPSKSQRQKPRSAP